MSSVHGDNAFEGDLHLGGQTFQFPSLACLKIWYEGGGGLQISILMFGAHWKHFKIHIESMKLRDGDYTWNPYFAISWQQITTKNQGKYFAMTCFNQFQIMNFTKFIVSLTNILVGCVKSSHCRL